MSEATPPGDLQPGHLEIVRRDQIVVQEPARHSTSKRHGE